MGTNAVAVGLGGDDALNADLLESFKDTVNFFFYLASRELAFAKIFSASIPGFPASRPRRYERSRGKGD